MRVLFAQKENLEKIVHEEQESIKKKKLKESFDKLEIVVVKALAEIGKELYHFNFSKEIIKYVLRFAFRRHKQIQEIMCDFVGYFMLTQNPSTYQYKLLILEHFGKLIKLRKFVKIFPEDLFSKLTHVYAEGASTEEKLQKDSDTLDERIEDLKEKKKKNKLSKAGEKQLKELESQRRRRNERRKRKGIDDPRLQKELKAQMEKSEATLDPARINRLVGWVQAGVKHRREVLLHHVQDRERVPRQPSLHQRGGRDSGPCA